MTLLLAQQANWSSVNTILMLCTSFIVVLVVFWLVYAWLLRPQPEPPENPAEKPGFTLAGLREMAERGEISFKEYETLKAKIIAKFKKSQDYQQIPPAKQPVSLVVKPKGKSDSQMLPAITPSFELLDDTSPTAALTATEAVPLLPAPASVAADTATVTPAATPADTATVTPASAAPTDAEPTPSPAPSTSPGYGPAEPTAKDTSPAEPTAKDTSPAEPTAKDTSPAEPAAKETSPAEPAAKETSPATVSAPPEEGHKSRESESAAGDVSRDVADGSRSHGIDTREI